YYLDGYSKMQNTDQAAVAGQGSLGMMGAIVALPTAMTLHQISTLGGLVAILCYAIMLVSVAGIFSMLGIYLILGPVFIPLGLTDAFSSFFYKWVGVVLSFFLVIPIYGATLAVIMALLGGSVINLSNLVGLPSLEHVFQAVIGPIISVGLILGVNKIASSLTGAYFGQTGSMAFSIGAAAAGIGAKLGLSAATAGAGAPAAAGAGGASGSAAVTAAVSGSSTPAASAVREG
ncbi:MAG TPA: type IV secretion system protein, partial [Acidobacteriota bacterium]|nr:type IV secretion system protein [Acidobacteriota bacterium]